MTDKNGKKISKGDNVQVDDPKSTDIHNHAFQGTVVGIDPDGTVVVADQEDECFAVDADSVEVE